MWQPYIPLTHHGASGSAWVYVFVLGLLLTFGTQDARAGFPCPSSSCNCVPWTLSGSKVQNITCSNVGLTAVPTYNKTGEDVIKFDLSRNGITQIEQANFQYLSNLVYLDLSYNDIASIEADTFFNVSNLQYLSYAGNANLGFPSEIPDTIESLDISYMNLDIVQDNSFNNLNHIKELFLDGNRLTLLKKNTFNGLTNLEKLYLDGNLIDTIHRDAFEESTNLLELDLSNNRITSLDDRVFDGLTSLELLDISRNSIGDLDDELFRDLGQLHFVYLSNNNLTFIDIGTFDNNPNLAVIDLSNNFLTTLSTTLFGQQTAVTIDVSNNPFICDCDVRDYLLSISIDAVKTLNNIESTSCTKNGATSVYLDWQDLSCPGYLGDYCNISTDCKVRNSECSNGVCSCKNYYYDNNEVSVLGGLCRPTVQLDYPCDINAACDTTNAECRRSSSSSKTTCLCIPGYYDTSPVYLGGSCEMQVQLGATCTAGLSMCNTTNSECTSGVCTCDSDHYDNNTVNVAEGECLPKLILGASCNATYQCKPDNSECLNNTCQCSTGHHDFQNNGECQESFKRLIEVILNHKRKKRTVIEEPSNFFSCYPTNLTNVEVHFRLSQINNSVPACMEFCFRNNAWYFKVHDGVCICGDLATTARCCPLIMENCQNKYYLGPNTGFVTAGITIGHVPLLYVGTPHAFVVASNISSVYLVLNPGDSETNQTFSSNSVTFSHTYTRWGVFTFTVYACVQSTELVCDVTWIPVRVQVPQVNLTAYLTGHSKADVNSNLTGTTATFSQGIDANIKWYLTDPQGTNKTAQGCEATWIAHRQTCIQMVTGAADFTSATSGCTAKGASLLKMNFEVEIAEVISLLGASSTEMLTGARRIGGVWTWTSDNSRTFITDTKLVDSANDCVIVQGSTGTLTTVSCTTTKQYVCMKDPVDCPYGGTGSSSGYCYLLSSAASTNPMNWTNAQSFCSDTYNGFLANITDMNTDTMVAQLLAAHNVNEAYFGLHDRFTDGTFLWAADNSSFDISKPDYNANITENFYDCFTISKERTWRSVECDMLLPFVCQYSVSIDRVTVTARLAGTPDIQIESGRGLDARTSTETHSDPSFETDVLMFPGISLRSGIVLYWNFHPENLSVATPIAFQIYKPSCQNNQNLVQPGCAGTMFSTCENTNPSCQSSATCSENEYFCYLSNTCKSYSQPCTCTSEGSLASGACNNYGAEPTYTLKGSTSFTIQPGSETPIKLTAGLDVDELDIVAIQVPRGTYPIKYSSSVDDHAQQTVYRIPFTGWVEKYTEVASSSKTVMNHTFYFQAIYTQNIHLNLPQSIGFVSSVGIYRIAIITDTESRSFEIQLEESITDVQMIYPVISESGVGDHLGVVNTEFNTSINFTISVGRGTNLTSIWSFNSSAVIPFSDTCPSEVYSYDHSLCNSSLSPTEKPFSFFEQIMSSTGERVIQVVISNILESVTKNVTIRTEKRISGLNFVLVNTSLAGNFVPLGVDSLFQASIVEGTGVTYVYYVNGSPVSANVTNQLLLHTFIHTGTFVVGVQAFNNLGNEMKNITVYSKIAADLRNCSFIQSLYVAATNIPVHLTVQCNVEVNAEVSSEMTSNATSLSSTTPTVTTTSDQHQWIHEETFPSAGNVTVIVIVKDYFQEVLLSTLVTVYNAIPSANLDISRTDIYPGETISLIASIPSSPGNYGNVTYFFDFGDGSNVTVENGSVTHTYVSPGNHTVTVMASSGPSNVTIVKHVVAYVNVTGLTSSYNGPKQTGSMTTFNTSILTGNFVSCRFLSTEFNSTVSSGSFSFVFLSAGDYNVTVTCFNALSQQESHLIAYILDPSDLRITALKINNNVNTGCIESITQNIYSLELLHYDIDGLTISWAFQIGQTQVTNVTYINQSYSSAGNYSLNVTVTYQAQNAVASIQRIICVQDRITSASISVPNILGLPSSKSRRDNATVVVSTGSALVYTWSSNATILSSSMGSTIEFEVTSSGFYYISVIVSNEINSEVATSIIQVIYQIDGLGMDCAGITEYNGEYFIENGTEIACNAVVSQGTNAVYFWDLGDSIGTNLTGSQIKHTYIAIGIHNITLFASNSVGSSMKIVVVHVEVPLTDVRLALTNPVWKTNQVNSLVKDININDTAVFTAIATPTGMTLNYTWVFDTGLQAITNSSNIGYHIFTSTGYKTTNLIASNSLNNVSKSVSFYVIREITSLIVKDGDTVLLTSVNYMISVNSVRNFTVTSTEIVPNTVAYIWRIKKGNVLVGSNVYDFIIFNCTEEENYTLSVEVRNALGSINFEYVIEATKPISGPFINATGGSNVTAGSVIHLAGFVTEGRNVIYTWSFIQAPASEVFPSPNTGQNVAVTLTSVGTYIIQLHVENSISTPLTATYRVNVMTGVTGVNISVTTPFNNAVLVGTMLNLQATVTAGTNLTYIWQVYSSENTGSIIDSGTDEIFSFTFHNQTLYNITLQVQNYASSGFSSVQIYSLHTVPSFSLDVNSSSFVNSIQSFAVKTNDVVLFTNNITDTAYISFTWRVNNTVDGTTENMAKQFSSPGTYILSLEATNLISQRSSSASIVVQDAISNFSVSNCVGQYLIDVGITSIASYATGSDVIVTWDRQHLTQSTGTKIITQFQQTGNYSMNVTASNYVTSITQQCMLEIQGPIGNLTISKSKYNYTGYNITFDVTGNYLDRASFVWIISNNVKQTTYVRYLSLQFAVHGIYNVTVTVSNAVSTSSTSLTFTVVDLLCTEPVITVNGETSRLSLRSRGIEFAVSVSASGCYVTTHQWKIYNSTSCSSAGTEVFLPNSTSTDTPVLQIPKSTLESGTYCIAVMISYVNTPVLVTQQFNLTITESPLTAIITGGDERSVSAESYLVLNASSSKDTNEVIQVHLTFAWNCSQNMGTTSAIAVCSAIRAINGASANLTNLQLVVGDTFIVTVTVSAQGRGSSSTTQTIHVVSNSSPAVNIICVSCAANEIYRMNSKQISLIGECSDCDASAVTYDWSVTDGSGSPVTITNQMTSTGGTNGNNLVIKSGQLNPSDSYTFILTATVGSSSGFASISMIDSSAPTGGNCAVTCQNIVPLENKCTVTCWNYTDADQTSGIYYRIVVGNSEEEVPLYFGSQTVYSFFVAPFPGTNMADVYVQVYVSNDNGVEILSMNGTVSFTAPSLSGSDTNIDFIIDNIKTNLVNIVNQNNPASLMQYSVAVLLFLNDQSLNNVGTASERMALRKLIGWALYGIPRNSLWDIQLLASAIKYLTAYSDELSSDTIDKASTEIENIVGILQSEVVTGKDPKTFETINLLNSVNNLQEALQQESSAVIDSSLMAEFGDLNQYVLAVSTSKSPPVYTNEEERFQAMIQKSIQFSTQLMLVLLQTTVPNESINKSLADGSVIYGVHKYKTEPQTEVSSSGVKIIIPTNVITNHVGDSAYQIYSQNDQIRLNFGFRANSIGATTKTFQTGFYATNGDKIKVSNLDNKIKMYMFNNNTTPYQISSVGGLSNSTGYQPQQGVNMTSTSITSRRTFVTSIDPPSTYGTAMFIMVTPNFTSATDTLTATLFKNDVIVEEKTISNAMLQGPHENYTFFVQNDNVNGAFKLHVYSTANVNVSVGKYHASCSYFNDTTSTWETNGCEPTSECIPSVIVCECNHMTSFGGGIFVSPADIHFTDLTEVDIISNPVAIITCSVLLGLYIIGVVICRRMDLLDIKRISSIPLCGKDGSFKYEVTVVTGRLPGAGTSANVGLRICGEYGKSARQHIAKDGAFRRNCTDTFIIAYDVNLGDLHKVQIWHDNSGMSPAWYLSYVLVNDLQTDQKYYFFANTWLSLEQENGSIEKELKTAGAEDMNRFGHRMSTAMFNSLADKHLWVSLLNRPAQSRFTRVQRITCCVTLLFTFIGVNAMWYGLLKKDNTEIGFGEFGWEEIVLALVSNLMVFPVNLGIMFLFKKSRSKANVFEHIQKPQTAQTLEIENLCGNSQAGSFESHQTGAIPYDLDRESTIDSVPAQPSYGLRRSRPVTKTQRENTDDSLFRRPVVAVTSSSAKNPMWTEDNIMKWPETVPYDSESRPSTSSTVAGPTSIRQPPAKAGGSTPASITKSKGKKNKCGPEQLLAELDKMEQDLKQSESRSLRSSESRRKPSMTKSTWEELEDILHSDDESVAGSSKKLDKKRGSMASQGSSKRFNPRTEPRIGGHGTHWPKPRDSIISGTPDISGPLTAGTSQGIAQGLRPGYFREMTVESRDIRQIPIHKEKCSLPPWCVYIGYVLCFLLSAFSVIIVILYCFQFGYDESLEWLLACLLSLLLSVCLIEPFKALIIAVYVVAMQDNVEQDQDDDYIDIEPTFDNSSEKIKDVKFKPITGFALLQAKEEGKKIHRMNVMLRQFFAYVFYLWLIMAVVYINFKQDNYLQHSYIEKTFTETTTPSFVSFRNISSISEYWDWTENVLVDSLHLQDAQTDEEHGYLLGAARLRLIRSTTMKCHAATAAAKLGASVLTDRICYGDSDYEEDTLFYGERWNDSSYNRSWKYNWANELGGSHKIGHAGTYGGGGYTQVLGTSHAETLTIVQDLKDKGWIDLRTRAVIVEFSLYSPGTDMTAMVALLIEFPLTGGAIASYEIQTQRLLWFMENQVDPLMVLECILLLVVIYSMIHIALRIRDIGKQFFKEFWNWYEMLTTLMTIVSVGMYIGCVVQATNTFNNFLDDQANFTNFEHVAYVHVGMRYLNAWLLFLLMYKVVKQLRFIRFLHVYEKTLSTAFGQLVATGLIFVILLFIYAQIGYLMYGRVIAGFQTVGHAFNTLIVIIRGSFDFYPMLDIHPVFSHFYLYSFYAFVYGLMIALVIAVLISTYKITKSQMYFKSTLEMQDYEMIDFMMKRFKLWAGIQKPKPAFRRVRFPGLPSISSRSSSSYSNRSSASLQSAQSITDPEYSQVQLRCMMARLTPTWQAVLRRFEKIEALEREEEDLVNKAENKMKDLNWKCRINQLEREHKEILEWKNTKPSAKPPVGDAKQRQSILKRLASKDNQVERKAPATVTGSTRSSATPPAKEVKNVKGKRPLSDQGARSDLHNTRTSTPEKSKIQKFFKSVKPSKPAWDK